MTNSKNGNRRIDAGLGRCGSSAQSKGASGSGDVGRIVGSACRNFALSADWQQAGNGLSHRRNGGLGDLVAGYRLSENHEGLHSGMFISVSLLRGGNTLAVRGGCYDKYGQPRNVCGESVALREVTAESLGCLLMEMHDRLCHGAPT